MNLFQELQHFILDVKETLYDLTARNSQRIKHGTVAEVDAKKQVMRLLLGPDDEGQGGAGGESEKYLSPWIPYNQIAGTRKVHSPPSKGQQMTLISPNGFHDELSYTMPYTFSDNNPSPSEDPDADVEVRGRTRKTQKDGSYTEEIDGITRSVTKKSRSVTIHRDPETKEEGKDEEVSDKKPWKGNRAKARHTTGINEKDGHHLRLNVPKDKNKRDKNEPEHSITVHPKDGYSMVLNVEDDENEHKITYHPEKGFTLSFGKEKHKITVNKDSITHSFDNGEHEVSMTKEGIKHKSSQRVTIDSPQIAHMGDMMLSGSLSVEKVIQSGGFIGNLQGTASGTGFLGGLTPPTKW